MDWRNEMHTMLSAFERQTTISLCNIEIQFAQNGLAFNDDFKQYFLQASNNRIKETYEQFQINSLLGLVSTNCASTSTSGAFKLFHNRSYDTNNIQNVGTVELTDSSDEEDQPGSDRLKLEALEELSAIQDGDHDEIPAELNDTDHFHDDGNCTEIGNTAKAKDMEVPAISVNGNFNMDSVTKNTSTLTKRANIVRSKLAELHPSEMFEKINSNEAKKRLKCKICQYSNNKRTNFKRHMLTHTGEKPHRCDICHKGFARMDNMKMHKVTHTNDIPFHCRGCFSTFSQLAEREVHEKVCKNRRYECHICKKCVNVQKFRLKLHMRTHIGAKSLRCDICMKRFQQKSVLKRHLNTIHIS